MIHARFALLALVLVGFATPAAADDLVVATVNDKLGRTLYSWSAADGWSEPLVSGRGLTVDVLYQIAFGSNVSGGFGCPVLLSDGATTVRCSAGACGATPLITRTTAAGKVVALVATERDVFAFSQRSNGFSDPSIGIEKTDTVTGEVTTFPDVSVNGDFRPTIWDAVLRGSHVDVLLSLNVATLVNDGTVIVRLGLDGTKEREIVVPGIELVGAEYHAPSDTFLALDRSNRLHRFDSEWRQMSSKLLDGNVGRFGESVAVVGSNVFLLALPNGVFGASELRRYSFEGDLLSVVNVPPGVSSVDALHQRRCVPDETRVLLGPDGRLELSGVVTDFQGNDLPMRFPPKDSRDSVEAFVFEPDNREGLFKALDGCALNDRIWFFGALATTTAFELTVRDRVTGVEKTYRNPSGQRASAIEDTQSFPCN